MKKNILIYIFTSLFILNCSTKNNKEVHKYKQNIYSYGFEIENCEPVVGDNNIERNSSFKYGCFCGRDYPYISNQDIRHLSESDKIEYIRKLQKIKPIDDIDRACKYHDICYVESGGDSWECDHDLTNTLSKLSDSLDKRRIGRHGTKEWRCGLMIIDMRTAFSSIFKYSQSEKSFLFQFFAIPIRAAGTVVLGVPRSLLYVINTDDHYPYENERCNFYESYNNFTYR